VVICLERGADLHTAQLMPLPLTVSCFGQVQVQVDFTFLVPADTGIIPDNGPLNVCVCVCVCVYVLLTVVFVGNIFGCFALPGRAALTGKHNTLVRRAPGWQGAPDGQKGKKLVVTKCLFYIINVLI